MQHAHARLNIDDLRGAGNPLRVNTYEVQELAEFVEKFCKLYASRFITERQRAAVARYQSNYESSIYNLASERYPEERVMQAYLELFDDLFFFGALKSKVALYCKLNQRGDCLGVCESNGGGWAKITIFCCERPNTSRRERMIQFTECLAHEMCHAIFAVYGCPRGPCVDVFQSIGSTGHGASWQYAAYAVEHAAWPVLDLKYNLHRMRSLRFERQPGRLEQMEHWELPDTRR